MNEIRSKYTYMVLDKYSFRVNMLKALTMVPGLAKFTYEI